MAGSIVRHRHLGKSKKLALPYRATAPWLPRHGKVSKARKAYENKISKDEEVDELPGYTPDPTYVLTVNLTKPKSTSAESPVKEDGEKKITKGADLEARIRDQLTIKFFRDNYDGALEFAKLLVVHHMTWEETEAAHSTFGDWILEETIKALMEAEY